jgi:hypothetical protein
MDDTPHDHGEAVLHPRLVRSRIEGLVEADVFSQAQQRGAGTVFERVGNAQGLWVGFVDDLTAQRGLEGEQDVEGQAGDTPVIGMTDAA